VIGCTANAFEDERERCERAGMDQLLVKPVTLDQLAQSLARFLPSPSFNIQTLRGMTQADEPVLPPVTSAILPFSCLLMMFSLKLDAKCMGELYCWEII